jgi:hypothetical protein
MCWNEGRLYWKIAKLFYFCHLKKLVRPETFGPTLVHRCGWFGGVAAYMQPDQPFKVTEIKQLCYFSIQSPFISTYWYWYINLTIDGAIYPSRHFPCGAAFVCQAGNFDPTTYVTEIIVSFTKQKCGKQWHLFLQQMAHFSVVSVGRYLVSRKIRVYSEKWRELLRWDFGKKRGSFTRRRLADLRRERRNWRKIIHESKL